MPPLPLHYLQLATPMTKTVKRDTRPRKCILSGQAPLIKAAQVSWVSLTKRICNTANGGEGCCYEALKGTPACLFPDLLIYLICLYEPSNKG